MGLYRARLIVKGWRESTYVPKDGKPKTTLGYLDVYDVDTKNDATFATTFWMDDAQIDRTPQVYDLDMNIRQYGKDTNLTITRIQVVNGKS